MTFNFNKLNARLPIYGGDLEKALFSVQREDYIDLIHEIEGFDIAKITKIHGELINSGMNKDVRLIDVHNAIKNNIFWGYKVFFDKLDLKDSAFIGKKASILKLQHDLNKYI